MSEKSGYEQMKELVKTEFFQYYTQSEIDIILKLLKDIEDSK